MHLIIQSSHSCNVERLKKKAMLIHPKNSNAFSKERVIKVALFVKYLGLL